MLQVTEIAQIVVVDEARDDMQVIMPDRLVPGRLIRKCSGCMSKDCRDPCPSVLRKHTNKARVGQDGILPYVTPCFFMGGGELQDHDG